MRSWLVLKLRQIADELEETDVVARTAIRIAFLVHRICVLVLPMGKFGAVLSETYRMSLEGRKFMVWAPFAGQEMEETRKIVAGYPPGDVVTDDVQPSHASS